MLTLNETLNTLKNKYEILGIVDCDVLGDSWHKLFVEINQYKRECFDNSQRIVITSTYDYYKNNHGLILESLQTILNVIDIPNFFVCFVSTNKNIKEEYKYILENFSIDNTPINIIQCTGNFENKILEDVKSYKKITNIDNDTISKIKSLDSIHTELLFKNKTFCIAPWVSLMIHTVGTVRPCCEYTENLGSLNSETIDDIWNNSKLTELRKDLLNNKKPKGCSNCYYKDSLGRESLRNSFNRKFLNHISKVDKTVDGKLENFELAYVDSRHSNLCNLSCRSCNPYSSSSWNKPAITLGLVDKNFPVHITPNSKNFNLLDQVKKHIDTLEEIYFAGGEPLMMEETYLILKELDKAKKYSIRLTYNTNLTKSYLKDKNIFDYWKNFENITIAASLDGESKKAEYLRCGTVWKDVVNFRKELLDKRPDIDFYISATTSIMNVLHVPDFHRSWVDQGLILPSQFNVHTLTQPKYLDVSTAPVALKEMIKEKYKDHLKWLIPNDPLGRATFGFESILKQIESDNVFNKDDFWKNINQLDKYYNTNLIKVFPELEILKDC